MQGHLHWVVVHVVFYDSYIQCIVLATEKSTATQQVSPRPIIKCQPRSWSQRGTKVNGSLHGGNPLLRPTRIQIGTKRFAAPQAMSPINVKATSIDAKGDVSRNGKKYRGARSVFFPVLSLPRDQRIVVFFSPLISLVADGPHHYHPVCGHEGSSHLSPVHTLQLFIAIQVQHSYKSSTNG